MTTPKAKRGRPHVKDPAKTYKGLSYFITTFRLKKRTIAEADVIEEALGLGSRTNALQYAIEQVFKDLHKLSRSMTLRRSSRTTQVCSPKVDHLRLSSAESRSLFGRGEAEPQGVWGL